MSKLYIRPTGLISTHEAAALGEPVALPLAGGWRAFTVAELIRRYGPADIERETISASALVQRAVQDPGIASLLARITTGRASIAGLRMTRPALMGIVNVTPDSFSDGGAHLQASAAIAQGAALAAAGAAILDIGGESTRPGSDPVDTETERARVEPVIAALASTQSTPVSVDTRKAAVMSAAIAAGAAMLNDVSALTHDPAALQTAGKLRRPVVLMHAQGDPKTMQTDPTYDDVLLDVYDFLAARIGACTQAGLSPADLVVDPGIGFGKTLAHNHALLRGLSLFHGLGVPILLGASRKSFMRTLPGGAQAADRMPGSIATTILGAQQGVQLFRVHDVMHHAQALDLFTRLSIDD